jgi:XRE family aerobic/anaerobic benzoate catabolism transcriptional regulator
MRSLVQPGKPDHLLARIGARIRAARTAQGASRAQLAARSGVSLRFLAQLESGDANISLLRLQEVAQALDLDWPALLGEDLARGNHGAPSGRRQRAHGGGVPADIATLLAGRTAGEMAEVRDWLTARFAVRRGPLIALLGLRGAGKSTVGKELARRLRVPFYELDALIERRAGLPLAQIFELQGEPFYRRLERETLAHFLDATPAAVLATGGGLVTDRNTFALLRARATTVWLQATPELHWRRVVRQGDRRPMRDHPGAMHELRALLSAREPLYNQAHVRIETSDCSAAAVAEALAARLVPGRRTRRRTAPRRGVTGSSRRPRTRTRTRTVRPR